MEEETNIAVSFPQVEDLESLRVQVRTLKLSITGASEVARREDVDKAVIRLALAEDNLEKTTAMLEEAIECWLEWDKETN